MQSLERAFTDLFSVQEIVFAFEFNGEWVVCTMMLIRMCGGGVHIHALVGLHKLEHHLDLGLDGRIDVVEHLAHAFDGLVRQVLFRELAEGEHVRTPDYPEEKLRVRDPKLPHVLRKRGIEVWKLVVQLREDAPPQCRVSFFLRIVLR